jgi:hypothetical protein
MNYKVRVATIAALSIVIMLEWTILLSYGLQQAESIKNPQFCYTTEPSKGNTLKNCFTTKGACDDALHDDPGATSHKCKTD